MCWRKWLVRGLVFSVAGGLATVGFLYQRWTNPAAVRSQVIAKLSEQLVGANVTLDSAQMRLLGGISLSELRLTRRDDPDKADLAYVPSAIIYPDKERILDGQLAIRKIELYRPRLRVCRGRDGRWNTTGLLGPVHPHIPIPIIVVQQGTLVLEDHCAGPGMPAVEITDVNLTLINNPLPTLNLEGKGTSDLAGHLQIKGKWQRATDATSLSVQAEGIPIAPALIERLGSYWPQLLEHALHLNGTGQLQAELAYTPKASRPWTHNVRLRLTDGQFSHPRVPLPLDHMEATVRCLDGQINLEKLTARADSARVEMSGTAQGCQPDADCDGTLRVAHLPICADIFNHLPDNLQKINAEFAPAGPVSLTCQFTRKAGQWYKRRFILHAEDLTASYFKFPYALEHTTGTLDQEIDLQKQVNVLDVDLTGMAGPRPVHIKGQVTGEGRKSGVAIKIWGEDLPLDAKLRAALPPANQKLAASFQPTGLADFEVAIQRPLGNCEFTNRFTIRFHHATVRYDVFPYPLENVSGVLDIFSDHHWEFTQFRGSHKGCEIVTSGRMTPATPTGDKLDVEISGANIVLDPEFETALFDSLFGKEMKQAWKLFEPTGKMKFVAHVERLAEQTPEVDVTITAQGCSIQPSFFPYLLTDLSGTIHYARRWLTLENLQARHGPTRMAVDQGQIYLKPEGGAWAKISTLQAAPLIPDADLFRALPRVLSDGCINVQLRDPVSLKTQLTIDSVAGTQAAPDVYWDGELLLRDATLQLGVPVQHIRGKAACRGRYNGHLLEGLTGNFFLETATVFQQPFRNVQSRMVIQKDTPTLLDLPGLRAQIFGGELYGPVHLEFGRTLRYELNLTASQIRLEEFGRQNLERSGAVSGMATAHLLLNGQGMDLANLTGAGTIDVPNGRLYNLPPFLDLLKFLTLRPPDGTAFEEAHSIFAIRGQRVIISRLDLFGNVVNLRGQGEMNLDGTDINLDFYAVWARVVQYLPRIIKGLSSDISKHLLKIKARGKLNDLHFEKEPVPLLVDPLREMLEKMRLRVAGSPPAAATGTRYAEGPCAGSSDLWPDKVGPASRAGP